MTKKDQKQKVLEFIARGEEIGKKEYIKSEVIGPSQVKGPLYEAWISEINVFNERYLKDHPLYSDIHSAFFHHNTNRKSYQNMMGYLKALSSDTVYWEESQSVVGSAMRNEQRLEGSAKNTMTPTIFISHRTEDATVADMLRDYLVATGIPNEYIFCSSLPGNDIVGEISREVKEKIANSSVNIAILSRGYYESAYCINEAGIIWYQTPETPAVAVGLPEISHNNMLGFLNGEYKLRRLDDLGDISAIYDVVSKAVNVSATTMAIATTAGQKLMTRYIEFISKRTPKMEQGKKSGSDDNNPIPPLKQIEKLLYNPEEWVEEDSRFYHSIFPQFTIVIEDDCNENGSREEGNREFYHHLQMDTRAYYGTIKIFYNGTQLYSCQSTELDGHRMTAPCPDRKVICCRDYYDRDICMRYYITSDLKYLLLRFLEHHIGAANGQEAQHATRRLLEVVLLFDNEEEVSDFVEYVHCNLRDFDIKFAAQREPYIADETDTAKDVLAKEIRNSKALKEMQPEWKQFVLEYT